ncbi:unnamed protein product [Litomosoides sigmodontis]|uniref:C2H2-type domain-containing protein n=1 Tax=Litomosoides sigmodontis TaxID=42156 RepID=A0A3P6UKH3_LITSI|nr:unnamed protein product [Litomosoides sigmodontis]
MSTTYAACFILLRLTILSSTATAHNESFAQFNLNVDGFPTNVDYPDYTQENAPSAALRQIPLPADGGFGQASAVQNLYYDGIGAVLDDLKSLSPLPSDANTYESQEECFDQFNMNVDYPGYSQENTLSAALRQISLPADDGFGQASAAQQNHCGDVYFPDIDDVLDKLKDANTYESNNAVRDPSTRGQEECFDQFNTNVDYPGYSQENILSAALRQILLPADDGVGQASAAQQNHCGDVYFPDIDDILDKLNLASSEPGINEHEDGLRNDDDNNDDSDELSGSPQTADVSKHYIEGAVMYECLVPWCTEKMWTTEERRKHHKKHMVKSKFFCHRLGCGRESRSLKSLIKHDKTHDKRFACGKCYRLFRTMATLLRHQKISCKTLTNAHLQSTDNSLNGKARKEGEESGQPSSSSAPRGDGRHAAIADYFNTFCLTLNESNPQGSHSEGSEGLRKCLPSHVAQNPSKRGEDGNSAESNLNIEDTRTTNYPDYPQQVIVLTQQCSQQSQPHRHTIALRGDSFSSGPMRCSLDMFWQTSKKFRRNPEIRRVSCSIVFTLLST